jgi:hypothetical protein
LRNVLANRNTPAMIAATSELFDNIPAANTAPARSEDSMVITVTHHTPKESCCRVV